MNNSPDLERKKLDSIETLDANEYLSVSQFKNMKESITQAKTNEEIDSILEQANYFGLINHRDELIEELRQRQLEEEQIRDFEAKLRLATSHEELEKVFSLVLEQEHDNLKNPEFVSKARFASTKDSQPNVQKEDEKAVDFETNRQLYINNVKEFTHLADNVKEEYISKLVGCNSLDELRMIYNEVSELNDFGMDDIDLAADIKLWDGRNSYTIKMKKEGNKNENEKE